MVLLCYPGWEEIPHKRMECLKSIWNSDIKRRAAKHHALVICEVRVGLLWRGALLLKSPCFRKVHSWEVAFGHASGVSPSLWGEVRAEAMHQAVRTEHRVWWSGRRPTQLSRAVMQFSVDFYKNGAQRVPSRMQVCFCSSRSTISRSSRAAFRCVIFSAEILMAGFPTSLVSAGPCATRAGRGGMGQSAAPLLRDLTVPHASLL